MNMFQIVFSPTGGTQKVVDLITSQWEDSVNKIDLADAELDYDTLSLGKDDAAVI